MSKKIKGPSALNTANIKISIPKTVEIEFDHPVFCFSYLHKDFGLDACTNTEKRNFIEQIVMLSRLTWNQIQLAGRHQAGSEKIALDSIRTKLPPEFPLSEEVNTLLAFRFDGKKAFVGFRDKFIFHIFYIDRAFKAYNHG